MGNFDSDESVDWLAGVKELEVPEVIPKLLEMKLF